MAVKQYKPTTPSRRNMTSPSFDEVTKFSPEKSLIVKKKKPKRYGVHFGYTSEWKKAIVTLSEDSAPIAFFESMN